MQVTKLVAHQQSLILTGADVVIGIGFGSVRILGSFLGKRIVDQLPEKVFVTIIEVVLVTAGLVSLIRG